MEDYSSTTVGDENKAKLAYIEEITSNVDEVQKSVLSEIISRNAHVEYLRRHGLNGSTDRESFKRIMPVITYEDLQSDVNRIANGDKSPILTAHPVSEFFTSSGTSGGERKLIPMIEEELERRSLAFSLATPVIGQYVAGLDKGKGMYFMFVKAEAKTPGGLVAQPVVTSCLKSSQFKNMPYNPYTSPIETMLCLDSYQSIYSQMLCGLYQNIHVLRVGSIFASSLLRAIRFLEKHWTFLCNDIRGGTIDPRITDPSVREAVMKIMINPNPNLADFIEAECTRKSWQGIITRLWPNTKYIDAVVTGTMSQYIPTLDYYSNGLPLVSPGYASSECFFGLNLDPLCNPSQVSYTFLPTVAYFEFLPIHKNNMNAKEQQQVQLVDLADVKLGQEYELIVTTYAGLYRYKVGDVLRVSGFKNKAPQFNFVRRKNVVLSIDSDKTDEAELHKSVKIAVNHLVPFHATLVDYTSYADLSTIPGHYVLYWELRLHGTTQVHPSVFQDCCLTLEESLDSVYRQGRVADKSIGPLEIKIVESGTFDMLMDDAVSRGASVDQYKIPRCVTFEPTLQLLNSRVVSSYFSPKCPEWAPGHKQWHNN